MDKYTLQLSEKEKKQINSEIASTPSIKGKLQIILDKTGDLHCAFCDRHGIFIGVDLHEEEHGGSALADIALNDYSASELRKKIDELENKLAAVDPDSRLDVLTGELEKIKKQKENAAAKAESANPKGFCMFLMGYSDKQTLSYPPNQFLHALCKDYYFTEYAEGAIIYQYEKHLKKTIEDNTNIQTNGSPSSNHIQFKEQYDIALYFFYSGIYDTIYENTKQNASATAKIIAQLAGMPKKGESIRPFFSHIRKYDPQSKDSRKLYNLDSVNRTIDLLESQKLNAEKLRSIKDKIQEE